nr:glycosyltransferase family 4 protein [Halanaerobium polyolivorans]
MWSIQKSKLLLIYIYLLSNLIIVETNYQKQLFKKIKLEKTVEVIYTQIDDSVIKKQYNKSKARSLVNLPQDNLIIGNLCGFRYMKGADLFVEIALNYINNYDIDCYFLIGGCNKTDNLRNSKYILNKIDKINNRFIILDWINDINVFYQSIDLFVSTSRSEGLPGAIREAACLGLPILATNVGGTKEVIGNKSRLIEFNDNSKEDVINKFSSKINEQLIKIKNQNENIDKKTKKNCHDKFIDNDYNKKINNTLKNLF